MLHAQDGEGNALEGEARISLMKGRGGFEVAGRLRDAVSVQLRAGEAQLPFYPLEFGQNLRFEVALNGSSDVVAVRQPGTALSEFREIAENIVIAFFLAIVIRALLFQAFYIPSGSMEPQLYQGDRLIASKIGVSLDSVKRGEVIIFRFPDEKQDKDYIKRVVGLPGDVVQISESTLYVNGESVEEPYLKESWMSPFGPETVKEGHLMMFGDNRNNSSDSRLWGQLPAENLVARPLFIFWPAMREEQRTLSFKDVIRRTLAGEHIAWDPWLRKFFHRIR